MTHHKTAVRCLIVGGLLLVACLSTQIPLSIPSVAAPSITIPTVVLPTLNPPAIGLTLVVGAGGTPVPAGTAASVPATGGGDEAARWVVYALVALFGMILVILMFARFMRRTKRPDRSDE